MLNDAQQAAIQRAVTEVLGAPCQLEVRVAPVGFDPAVRTPGKPAINMSGNSSTLTNAG